MARSSIDAGVMMLQSLTGLPAFLAYFCTAFVVTIGYLFVYTRITPHDEFELIRENVPGAAIALGFSLLGFALPLASLIAHTENLVDCVIWSIIALIVQVIVYFVVRIPIPNLPQRIAAGDLAPAIWLGFSVPGGRRPERRIDRLLTKHPMKRSTQVSLVLIAAVGIGGVAAVMMPSDRCRSQPSNSVANDVQQDCRSRSSSGSHSGSAYASSGTASSKSGTSGS
jgi:putative membrane protein